MNNTQVLTNQSSPAPWVIGVQGEYSRADFLAHVRHVAEHLPDGMYAVNLCKDRYYFMVSFAAVMLKRQVNLLPPDEASGTLDNMMSRYQKSYCLRDESSDGSTDFIVSLPEVASLDAGTEFDVSDKQLAAVLFTSGTQGQPVAISKFWGELKAGAELTSRCFGLTEGASQHIVATVPSQHMFGLETSVLLPIICGTGVYRGRPFFPEDVRQALLSVPGKPVLVTTPVHLRALVESGLEWPRCAFLLSATAPLSADLARQAEEQFSAPVMEIYGSTETGAVASRRTTKGEQWCFYDGIEPEWDKTGCILSGGHLHQSFKLQDYISATSGNSFRLLGRHTDRIKIAGKRASLTNLNDKLLQINGVEDGVFFETGSHKGSCPRLAAIVVAPTLSKDYLHKELAKWMDPVFLPRPLRLVTSLPRSKTGKIRREHLLSLLDVRS